MTQTWSDEGRAPVAVLLERCSAASTTDHGVWGIRFAADGTPEAIPPPWVDVEQRPVRHVRFLTRRRPRAA